MKRDGIKLYSEADKLVECAGILESYLQPPNTISVDCFSRLASSVISALKDQYIRSLQSRDVRPYSTEQMRVNYTISELREQCRKYNRVYFAGKLRRNVWKP